MKKYIKYELLLLFHTLTKMKKPKIAISLDKPLLDLIDSKVDGSILRSRSQAMEFFLKIVSIPGVFLKSS